jgi:hypothetical protein
MGVEQHPAGTMDADLFNSYLLVVLLPLLCAGHIIVIDNASYHISNETRELIEDAGCYAGYCSTPNLFTTLFT